MWTVTWWSVFACWWPLKKIFCVDGVLSRLLNKIKLMPCCDIFQGSIIILQKYPFLTDLVHKVSMWFPCKCSSSRYCQLLFIVLFVSMSIQSIACLLILSVCSFLLYERNNEFNKGECSCVYGFLFDFCQFLGVTAASLLLPSLRGDFMFGSSLLPPLFSLPSMFLCHDTMGMQWDGLIIIRIDHFFPSASDIHNLNDSPKRGKSCCNLTISNCNQNGCDRKNMPRHWHLLAIKIGFCCSVLYVSYPSCLAITVSNYPFENRLSYEKCFSLQ